MTDWQPPEGAQVHIVCAGCRLGSLILAGARHFDPTMQSQMRHSDAIVSEAKKSAWDQGFIDQWGQFWSCKEAMDIVKANGQPFDKKRNGDQDDELFSEGLY